MTADPKLSLTFVRADSGRARVYYRVGRTQLICFQEDFPRDFHAYVCSQDGEPSHPYTVSYIQMHLLPKPPADAMKLTITANFWQLVRHYRGPANDPAYE